VLPQRADSEIDQAFVVRFFSRGDGKIADAGGLCDAWPGFRNQHSFHVDAGEVHPRPSMHGSGSQRHAQNDQRRADAAVQEDLPP
jgi:hypothetical protein